MQFRVHVTPSDEHGRSTCQPSPNVPKPSTQHQPLKTSTCSAVQCRAVHAMCMAMNGGRDSLMRQQARCTWPISPSVVTNFHYQLLNTKQSSTTKFSDAQHPLAIHPTNQPINKPASSISLFVSLAVLIESLRQQCQVDTSGNRRVASVMHTPAELRAAMHAVA
jgi:hypothetical protein